MDDFQFPSIPAVDRWPNPPDSESHDREKRKHPRKDTEPEDVVDVGQSGDTDNESTSDY